MKLLKVIIVSLIFLLNSILYGFGQSDSTSKKFQIEIGHNYSPRNNIYFGFKRQIFNNEKFLFRSSVIYSFQPKYISETLTRKYHNSIFSLGIEYHYFNKIKWFSPYLGIDILNYHSSEITTGIYQSIEKENAFGGVIAIGTQLKLKNFHIGIEVDFGYCYTSSYLKYGDLPNIYEGNYWGGWIFRYPLLYIGYRF